MTEREFPHIHGMIDIESPVVIQMLLDEVRATRKSQDDFQSEARSEFRRIHDKIDRIDQSLRKDLQSHDRDIVRLTTEASVAGRVAGFIAGTVSSILVSGAVWMFKHLIGG